MKKTFLLKMMLLLCALVAGSGTMWGDTVTFNYTDYKGEGTSSTGSEYAMVKTDVSITNTKFYGNNGYAQFYANGVTTVTPADGVTITQIVLTASGTSYNGYQSSGNITTSTGSVSGSATSTTVTWTGSATSAFTLSNGKQIRWTSIVVTYTKSGGSSSTVATPSLSLSTATYTTPQNVTITCETEGATIHYTTNGVDPTETDEKYSSPVSITTSGTVLKAKAFKSGMTASNVASATYTIKPNTPTISAMGATVTIAGDDGCTFYYTTNGSAPTNSSTEYTAPFEPGSDCTIKAIAYDTYGNASSATSFAYKYMPLVPKAIGSGYFVKVTDVTDLENGDAIIIVNETAKKAMAAQKTNNRDETGVTISDDAIYLPAASEAQKLVLVKKTEKISSVDTEVFYFYTGSGYLYAASSSSNYLKTEATPDDNGNARATITISSGDATITFKGTYSHNLLRYNSASFVFSCYTSGQDAVQIYKEVAHTTPVTVTAAGYATFVSDYDLDYTSVTGLKAYKATISGENITFTKVTTVPAGEGVLIKADAGNYNIPVTTGVAAWAADDNAFVRGTGAAVASQDGSVYNYVLSKHNDEVGFYPASGKTVGSDKAYISTTIDAARLTIAFDDETTGISSALMNSEKVNGVYNLNGQRVNKAQKGLYIINGKKVIK